MIISIDAIINVVCVRVCVCQVTALGSGWVGSRVRDRDRDRRMHCVFGINSIYERVTHASRCAKVFYVQSLLLPAPWATPLASLSRLPFQGPGQVATSLSCSLALSLALAILFGNMNNAQ